LAAAGFAQRGFYVLYGGASLLFRFKDTTMFAVIQTGGKQYKVAKDDIIIIEKLDGPHI